MSALEAASLALAFLLELLALAGVGTAGFAVAGRWPWAIAFAVVVGVNRVLSLVWHQ